MRYNLDAALEAKLAQEKAQEQTTEQAKAEHQKHQDAIDFGRVDALVNNKDLQWFIETQLRPMRDKMHDEALNVRNSVVERGDYAQRHDMACLLIDRLQEEWKRLSDKITRANKPKSE